MNKPPNSSTSRGSRRGNGWRRVSATSQCPVTSTDQRRLPQHVLQAKQVRIIPLSVKPRYLLKNRKILHLPMSIRYNRSNPIRYLQRSGNFNLIAMGMPIFCTIRRYLPFIDYLCWFQWQHEPHSLELVTHKRKWTRSGFHQGSGE